MNLSGPSINRTVSRIVEVDASITMQRIAFQDEVREILGPDVKLNEVGLVRPTGGDQWTFWGPDALTLKSGGYRNDAITAPNVWEARQKGWEAWLTERKQLQVAGTPAVVMPERRVHVGYTKSKDDKDRIFSSMVHRMELGDVPKNGVDDDFMDLTKGRDFLKETARYDTVILHRIFRGFDGAPADWDPAKHFSAAQCKKFIRSDIHSAQAWRERLLSTGAERIFVFGLGSTEVAPDYIGELPGYSLDFDYNLDLAVYRKRSDLSAASAS